MEAFLIDHGTLQPDTSKETGLSLHHAISSPLAGRLGGTTATAETAAAPSAPRSVALPGVGTMRLLEMGLALFAVATAVLIGLGH